MHELRVRHDAGEIAQMFGGDAPNSGSHRETVLLRVFAHFYGTKVVLLLGGYDKGEDPKPRRQQREIARRARCWLSSRSASDESEGERVDGLWATPHNGEPGGLEMARSYRDSTAARRARLAPGIEADRAEFEQVYGVAKQIVELREKHGLTQAQLAELSGIDQSDISRIERGATSPTTRTLQRVAEALGADLRLVARS